MTSITSAMVGMQVVKGRDMHLQVAAENLG